MEPDDDLEIHAVEWVLRLEKAGGQSGYFCWVAGDEDEVPSPVIAKEKSGRVQRFPTRTRAERCAQELVKMCGLEIEEATPEPVVHDKEIELRFGGGNWPDGMRVETDDRTGARRLLLWESGLEMVVYDLEEDTADLLVRLLGKLKKQLKPSVPKK